MANLLGAFVTTVWIAAIVLHRPPLKAWNDKLKSSTIFIKITLLVLLLLLSLQSINILGEAFPLSIVWSSINLIVNTVDLMVHEAGHIYFSLFGEFLHVLGGTLNQLLFPLIFASYCIIVGLRYLMPFSFFWLAINLFDISRYMADARARALPLFGDGVGHDWNMIFGWLGLLEHDTKIAFAVYSTGVLCMLLCLLLAIFNALRVEFAERWLNKMEA